MNEWTEEDKKWAKEVLTCRQIVSEINRFGVSSDQKIKIIELLSLELDDHEYSVVLAKKAREVLEKREKSTQETTKGRILV